MIKLGSLLGYIVLYRGKQEGYAVLRDVNPIMANQMRRDMKTGNI